VTTVCPQATFALTCKGFLPWLLDGEISVAHSDDTGKMLILPDAALDKPYNAVTTLRVSDYGDYKEELPASLPRFSIPYG
jgi:hypothetical protein